MPKKARKNARKPARRVSARKREAAPSPAPVVESVVVITQANRQELFLAAIAEKPNIKRACVAAGVSRKTHYDWLKDGEYAQRYADALKDGCDEAKAEAWRRGVDGVERLKFNQGDPCLVPAVEGEEGAFSRWESCDELDEGAVERTRKVGGVESKYHVRKVWRKLYIEREHSDGLLLAMLKAHDPDFRDKIDLKHSGKLINAVRVIRVDGPDPYPPKGKK